MDANPATTLRYNPQASVSGRFDIPTQNYTPKKDHFRYTQPGFTLGGDIIKDRLWFFAAAAPQYNAVRRTVSFTNSTCLAAGTCVGVRSFNNNQQTYFSMGRLDYKATERIRLYGSVQYAYLRETGTAFPNADSLNSQALFNTSSNTAPDNFNNGIGDVQPNILGAAGADITITPNLVATTRFGRFYYNYADRGIPQGQRFLWLFSAQPTAGNINGLGLDTSTAASNYAASSQASGFFNINANEGYQYQIYAQTTIAQDIAYFKKSRAGTHNLKFGYQLNHLLNNDNQSFQSSYTRIGWGSTYTPGTATGQANCQSIAATNLATYGTEDSSKWTYNKTTGVYSYTPNTTTPVTGCMGKYGYIVARDGVEVNGKASSNDHSFYAQDSWTLTHGLTINAGVRVEKEYLPSYDKYPSGISFGWGSKIAPRVGASWDVFQNGKLKAFGSYGVYYDQIRLNLAIGSFGGNYWHDCAYALDSANFTTFSLAKDASGHYCPAGGATVGANFSSAPGNVRFIENQDFRIPSNDPSQGAAVDPNLKPYREHTDTFGAEYQLSHNYTLQTSYLRTRVDDAIEDAGLIGANGEFFLIVNPGEGTDYQPVSNCPTCKVQPRAARMYDGLNVTLTKTASKSWFGQFVYTYSNLRGNYSGLTSTDIADAGGGRAAPNNNRAFDEPYFQFDSHGKPDNGKLPTDRPNTFKALAYYKFTKIPRSETTLGLVQQIYQGTPLTSYMDINGTAGSYPTNVEGRGKWVPVTQDATGNLIYGTPTVRRTPWYIQSDGSFIESFKVSPTHETWRAQFEANITNVFNHKAATIIQSHINTSNKSSSVVPTGSLAGTPNYGVLESPYDYQTLSNAQSIVFNSEYGLASSYQAGRTIRLEGKFVF
jgi:hypothetical protein